MDIVVIGGGPGGYVAAIAAAKRGAQVVLIEKDMVGGTCLNRGCIPTKAILHSANLFAEAKNFAEIGIKISEPEIDFATIMQRKSAVVKQLRGGVEFLLKKAGVKVIKGDASFVSEKEIKVCGAEGEHTIEFENAIIATGSAPADLPFAKADGETIINSNHALELNKLPESVVVIGGGVVGCEFAQAFARLGSKVTIVEMLPDLIANMEKEQSEILKRVLKRDKIDINLSCKVNIVTAMSCGGEVKFTDCNGEQKTVTAEKILIATGRRPMSAELDLEAAGVVAAADGSVKVNEYCATEVQGIYAIGDVAGSVQLAHVASHQGIIAVSNIFKEQKSLDERIIPYCIYTNPEIASMGLSEEKAKEQGYIPKTGLFPTSANGRSIIEGMKDGFSKIVADTSDGTILGIHLVGANVTEMISPLSGVIKFEATLEDVTEMIFAHPTVSEIIHESVLDADKKAIHIP